MILSVHHVDARGGISLVAANVPYSNLQWTRSLTGIGGFSLQLACPVPVSWPGRYLLVRDDADEVGVVEKVTDEEGEPPTMEGRFAGCLWERWVAPSGGASATGASWRQAATRALSSWHMGDLPPLTLGEGTQAPSGSSYRISCDEGKGGMSAVIATLADQGARVVVGYDRDASPTHLTVRILTGLDRTRSQSSNPVQVFSLEMGSAGSVSYVGDYSTGCSQVMAHAEAGSGDSAVVVDRTVRVQGFDAATQWAARCLEDVSQLAGDVPTSASVDAAARLRAYDHMPEVSVDCDVSVLGYRTDWDVGDLVEVEVPSLGLVAQERVQEAREVHKAGGVTVEATLGTKRLARVARAMLGRR